MNNQKTGFLIKELRKEKGMTQKELSDLLRITDRAVSKWERGLCAPDISLLQPLAEILGVSIVELIEGERAVGKERVEIVETAAKSVIEYSGAEMLRTVKTVKRKYIATAAICIAALMIICGYIFWQRGYFFIIDKSSAPDGSASVIVYNKDLDGKGFSTEAAVSLVVDLGGDKELRVTYGDCDYGGLWWSPDSRKYVLALEGYGGASYLTLTWLEYNSSSNLNAYLSMGVEATELAKYGYANESGWPEIEYRFLQWGKDSEAMLIYYSFSDGSGNSHEGYFWYNCVTGSVDAVLEIEPRENS